MLSAALRLGHFTNTGKSYGGFIFNFNIGRDISAYQTLKFAIDSSQMADYANLEVKAEDGDSGSEFGVLLSGYTPTILGDWAVYEIPLSDFIFFDPTNLVLLGFWNAQSAGGQLTFGTLYFDDIHFAEIAGRAFEMLRELIDGNDMGGRHLSLAANLVIRQTCAERTADNIAA